MRAAIVNSYLDTLGGGERYSLAVATTLVRKGYDVTIEWKDKSIKRKLEQRFGISLEGVKVVDNVKRGDGYDVCFWVSDGSIPLFRARRNFLHFQTPFQNVNGKSLLNRTKLYRVEKTIVNSRFTKKLIDKEYGVKSVVVYPPVAVEKIRPKRKENIILFVGRFSKLQQSKGQDILIKTFKRLEKNVLKDWKLVLAGGAEVGAGDWTKDLKRSVRGHSIEIIESPSFPELLNLYGKAKIFWSASGFGVVEKKNPEGVEHFGITTVEAMTGGAVPVVFDAGGHREVVDNGKTGLLWKELRNLTSFTKKIIEEKGLLAKLSKAAVKAAKIYDYERFETEISEII